MAHRSKEYDAMLQDTVALIAYEEPEVMLHCKHIIDVVCIHSSPQTDSSQTSSSLHHTLNTRQNS